MVAVIYALYTVESVGERNIDKIPAQLGSYRVLPLHDMFELLFSSVHIL